MTGSSEALRQAEITAHNIRAAGYFDAPVQQLAEAYLSLRSATAPLPPPAAQGAGKDELFGHPARYWYDAFRIAEGLRDDAERRLAAALERAEKAEEAEDAVLVPFELTEEMKVAGWTALGIERGDFLLGAAYRAMLSAAPSRSHDEGTKP